MPVRQGAPQNPQRPPEAGPRLPAGGQAPQAETKLRKDFRGCRAAGPIASGRQD